MFATYEQVIVLAKWMQKLSFRATKIYVKQLAENCLGKQEKIRELNFIPATSFTLMNESEIRVLKNRDKNNIQTDENRL